MLKIAVMYFLQYLYIARISGGAEFAVSENGRPKKNKDWKMQDLENDGLGYSKVLRNAKEQVVTVCTKNFHFFSEL